MVGAQRFDRVAYQARRGHAGGVPQCHGIEALAREMVEDGPDATQIHVAFERAAEGDGNGALALDGMVFQQLCDVFDVAQRLFDGTVQVLGVVAFGGRQEYDDFVGFRLQRAFDALAVGRQRAQHDARTLMHAFQDVLGIAHLRNGARRHERRGLEMPYASIDQRVQDLDFGVGGHELGLDLQPVTHADFHDFDSVWKAHGFSSPGARIRACARVSRRCPGHGLSATIFSDGPRQDKS